MKKNTKLLDEMLKSLRKMNGMKVYWGFDSEATYDEPRGFEKVSDVAQLVENGHKNGGLFPNTSTPERPFFKAAVDDKNNHQEVRKEIKRMYAQIVKGNMSPEDRLENLGDILVRQLRDSIKNFGGEIEPSTLDMRERRGSSSNDPLIESGNMLEAVTFRIEDA